MPYSVEEGDLIPIFFFKMPELTLQQQQKFYEQIAIEFLHFSFLSLLFFQIFKIASFYYFLVT